MFLSGRLKGLIWRMCFGFSGVYIEDIQGCSPGESYLSETGRSIPRVWAASSVKYCLIEKIPRSSP